MAELGRDYPGFDQILSKLAGIAPTSANDARHVERKFRLLWRATPPDTPNTPMPSASQLRCADRPKCANVHKTCEYGRCGWMCIGVCGCMAIGVRRALPVSCEDDVEAVHPPEVLATSGARARSRDEGPGRVTNIGHGLGWACLAALLRGTVRMAATIPELLVLSSYREYGCYAHHVQSYQASSLSARADT